MKKKSFKLLLTGITGQLGREIYEVLKEKFEIHAPRRDKLNLEEIEKIYSYCKELNPEILILCGAYTDVDGAEEEREKALKINFLSTKEFVRYAREYNRLLIFISTDYVFDGKKNFYSETDAPNPLNFYGKTKYLAEREIENNLKKYFIVRTSWLYGNGKNNFVYKFLEMAKKEKEIKVVTDRYGSPTFTKDLATAIEKLLYSQNYGIYHIVNTGKVSRFEFAEKIKEIKKLNIRIIPIKAEEYGEKAKRPRSSALKNEKFSKIFYPLRKWEEALEEFLKEAIL